MKKMFWVPIMLAFAISLTSRADQKPEDAALHKRNDEFTAAWNKHDPKALAAFWTAEGDLINPFGRHARGTAEIEKLMTEEQAGPMAGTTYSGTIESIRYLGKNHAIVDVAAEVTGMKTPDGMDAPPFKHHVTWIAVKKDGQWMALGARAFAYVPPPPPPAK